MLAECGRDWQSGSIERPFLGCEWQKRKGERREMYTGPWFRRLVEKREGSVQINSRTAELKTCVWRSTSSAVVAGDISAML